MWADCATGNGMETTGVRAYGRLRGSTSPLMEQKAAFHVLDPLAAVLSNSRLRAGLLASKYVEACDGSGAFDAPK